IILPSTKLDLFGTRLMQMCRWQSATSAKERQTDRQVDWKEDLLLDSLEIFQKRELFCE
ncbi:hypothetical protein WUBG_18884, partial [Wuchereria bancrofti]